jgi:GTP cyclohydrolase I
VDQLAVQAACRALLVALGEDPDRDGLRDTPARWARWWAEFIDHEPGRTDTTFDAVAVDQLVLVRGVRVWSLCEHHLLPFWCDLSIGYLTGPRLLGLSKLARVAQAHAHGLQVQERLVEGIAAEVASVTGSPDVGVVASGEHLCMTMRGVRCPATMVSSALHGRIRQDPALRAEFMALARGG